MNFGLEHLMVCIFRLLEFEFDIRRNLGDNEKSSLLSFTVWRAISVARGNYRPARDGRVAPKGNLLWRCKMLLS